MENWIKVSERLPEYSEVTKVWIAYHAGNGVWAIMDAWVSRLSDSFIDENGNAYNATHWMEYADEVPEPPKD